MALVDSLVNRLVQQTVAVISAGVMVTLDYAQIGTLTGFLVFTSLLIITVQLSASALLEIDVLEIFR